MAKPLVVEVVSQVLSSFDHCSHCQFFLNQAGVGQQIHREDFNAFPRELQEEYGRLLDVVGRLSARFGSRVQFRILDPQSMEGMWKSIRHWVRRYPTFLIGGEKIVGWDAEAVARRIEAHLAPERVGAWP
jgi:hypothetical protein